MSNLVSERAVATFHVLYLDPLPECRTHFINKYHDVFRISAFDEVDKALQWLQCENKPDAMIVDAHTKGIELLLSIRSQPAFQSLPFILVVDYMNPFIKERALAIKADDLFEKTFSEVDLYARIEYFVKRRELLKYREKEALGKLRTPLWKRSFDILFSSFALLLLSPLLLLVALLIKLDSRGPVLYKSKRVGMGYQVFNLYQFRSVKTGGDAVPNDQSAHNLYHQPSEPVDQLTDRCENCVVGNQGCETLLYIEGKVVCEKIHLRSEREQTAFGKSQDDLRITLLGAFLRNFSIDELPQLLNILLGDMSVVGNRPLSFYEAEKLTTDESILRFAAPAGLTGLWQVTKWGKKEVSEQERMRLDIEYAQKRSLWFDLKIILMTFPALFQKENV